MRVALIEVGHWHYPLYLPALRAPAVEVAAVSDRRANPREREAARFGAPAYDDPMRLIAEAEFDFAFAFGRHDEMAAIGQALVARGRPFAIEKPVGLAAADVARLRRAAEARDLYVAVPLVQRLGPLYDLLQRLAAREGARFASASWRFFAGPPARYLDWDCAWMLDPAASGGGAMRNLAAHFVDLSVALMGAPDGPVTAKISNALHGQPVEDYALLSFASASGGVATIETGYRFPAHAAKREYSFSLAGPNHYVRSAADGITLYRPGDDTPERFAVDHDSDPLYALFAERALKDCREGRPPPAGLAELETAIRVIDAGYAAAGA